MTSGTPPTASAGTILVVDDLDAVVQMMADILSGDGYRVLRAWDGAGALDVVAVDPPDLVIADVRMPGLDGFDLCRALKASPATRLIPVVLMTGASGGSDRLLAIEAGAQDFVRKPIDQAELKARVRSLMQIKRYTDDLDSAEAVLRSMALMVEARDAYTDGHCQRLARYATELGAMLNLTEEDLVTLGRGGYFHDIGKIALPDAILLKPAALTPEEFARVKEHPAEGERLCGNLRALRHVRPIIRQHHERLDGSGYPDGLTGDEISLLAQIIGIVDVYDAMTTDRPYRPAASSDEALGELGREVDRGWRRADLVEAFVAVRSSAGTIGTDPGGGLSPPS